MEQLITSLSNTEAEIREVEAKGENLRAELDKLAATAEPDDDRMVNAITALRTRCEMVPGAVARRNERLQGILAEIEREFGLQCKFAFVSIQDRIKEAKAAIGQKLAFCASDRLAETLASEVFDQADKPSLMALRQALQLGIARFGRSIQAGQAGQEGYSTDLVSAAKCLIRTMEELETIKF